MTVINKKKNCHNCKHLEWAFGDIGDSEGFICNAKDWNSPLLEERMIEKMSREDYLERAKVCCELEEKT